MLILHEISSCDLLRVTWLLRLKYNPTLDRGREQELSRQPGPSSCPNVWLDLLTSVSRPRCQMCILWCLLRPTQLQHLWMISISTTGCRPVHRHMPLIVFGRCIPRVRLRQEMINDWILFMVDHCSPGPCSVWKHRLYHGVKDPDLGVHRQLWGFPNLLLQLGKGCSWLENSNIKGIF